MANKNKVYTLSFDVKNGDDVEKVNIEIGKTAKSVGELEHQIETLTAAIKKAEFGTPEFAKLTKELGNAKTKLVNFEESIADITKAEKVEGLFRIGSAIAGGFAIAEAASTAFGEQLGLNQEQIAKTTAKFQVLLVTIEALQLVQEALGKENKFLTQLLARNSVATNAQTAATNKLTLANIRARIAQIALNIAQAANPIGAVILAISALVAGIYFFIKAGEKAKNVIRILTVLFAPMLAPILLVIDAIKALGSNLTKIKDFIAETTGLFDTEAQKQKKIKDAQFLEDKARLEKLKELSKQSFEDVTNIYRTQSKLRGESAAQQLKVEETILQLQLKNLQKEYEEKYKAASEFNKFLKDNSGVDLGIGEKTNADRLKALELELQIKDIQKQRIEQQKADIEALLAKIIERGEKEQLQAKLAGENEIQLARLKQANIIEQIQFLKRFYKEDSIQILKVKEQLLDTNKELKTATLAKNEELANAAIEDFKRAGASDLELLELRKKYAKDLLDFTVINFGELSQEAKKYRDELLNIDKDVTSKLFTKIDVEGLNKGIAKINEIKDKEQQDEKDRLQKRVELFQKTQESILSLFTAINDAITSQIDERIAQSQEKIAELDQQASDSVARSEALTASLEEARGVRRLDAIAQIEQERQKQKKLADEKLAQEAKIQAEEKKKQKLLATTNAINQTTAAINSIVATTEALKGTASQSKLLFPANVVAIAATVASIIAAFSAIKSLKFDKGGYTGSGTYKDETGHKVAGVVHDEEWVSPKWMVKSPKYGPTIQALEKARKNGFAQGGFTSNVVPNFSGINTSIDTNLMLMLEKLDQLQQTNIALANRKVQVSVEEINKVQTQVNTIKVNATT